MNCIAVKIIAELKSEGSLENSIFLQRFFKTGPGQYGEGDKFLGLRVPQTRRLAAKYKGIDLKTIQELLSSEWHEARLLALVIMRAQFNKGNLKTKQQIFDLYINNIGLGINNWDLVDISCPNIIGAYLIDKDRGVLYQLAEGGLWQKRVAIISTFYFLKYETPADTYKLAEKLVYDKADLIQKAVGWALREMGKVDKGLLLHFLDKYGATMPRTALRYAIEKLLPDEKSYYMDLKNAN